MPVTVLHLVDTRTPDDALRLLGLLLRDETARVQHRVVVMGPVRSRPGLPADIPLERVPVRFDWPLLSLPALRGAVQRNRPDVLHALGSRAAGVAGAMRKVGLNLPVVATITDPSEAGQTGRWWRSLDDGRVEVLCASKMVQRRLIERGVPLNATAVVRPGVDFAELNAARREMSRDALLGQPPRAETAAGGGETASAGGGEPAATGGGRYGGPVLVMPGPPTRAGGQFLGVWAVAMLHQIWPPVRLLIPGRSREADRIARLLREIYCPQAFVMTGERYSPAELLAVSDALIVPAVDDIPTGWIAWAMAAGVPVIGSAVHTVTEFIADRHNGFLCRPGEPHTLAIRIRTALESPELMRQCVEVARGHAYDVFRARQCIEQYTAAFTTLAGGQPAASAVRDAATN